MALMTIASPFISHTSNKVAIFHHYALVLILYFCAFVCPEQHVRGMLIKKLI